MNRRDALCTGLAAAFGLPLATAKENKNMVATIPQRCKSPEPCEPRKLIPAHPKNDARVERLTVLLHAFREDCWRIAEEHGEECDCVACEVVDGARWLLEVMEGALSSEQIGWTHFYAADERGAAKDVTDAAQRLQLPESLVHDYVVWDCPAPLADRINDALARSKAATA